MANNSRYYIEEERPRRSSRKISSGVKALVIAIALVLLVAILVVYRPRGGNAETDNTSSSAVTDNNTDNNGDNVTQEIEPLTEGSAAPASYMMEHSDVIPQVEYKAGCETYACTMMLQTLGYDIDEHRFLDDYLEIHWVTYGADGNRYGPDMYSGQAGDIYGGWGVYSPAMAKYINHYFDDIGETKRAVALEGVPLQELCEKYVANDTPVMVWATTWLMEPYEKDSWIVDYVDENARYEIGDTFTWLQNEHCIVLVGYDEENYYFMDSCAGKISEFDRETTEERYTQLGTQAIVVE